MVVDLPIMHSSLSPNTTEIPFLFTLIYLVVLALRGDTDRDDRMFRPGASLPLLPVRDEKDPLPFSESPQACEEAQTVIISCSVVSRLGQFIHTIQHIKTMIGRTLLRPFPCLSRPKLHHSTRNCYLLSLHHKLHTVTIVQTAHFNRRHQDLRK